uniref:Protein-glutamine gamma-glutamyltransferase 2 n=1 Tax=Pundamilia nyererei TaxID=303518 RepID=A0A3B4FVF1_9CICH
MLPYYFLIGQHGAFFHQHERAGEGGLLISRECLLALSLDSKRVNLNCETNNTEHGTKKISKDQLIVRRGQRFTVKVELTQPFNPNLYPLTFTAVTGENPSEDLGTKSCFGMPDRIQRSPSAKAVWKVELEKGSNPPTGSLNLTITPPADTPIGKYNLTARHRDEEILLAELVVLFNPWCSDDSVFMQDEKERQEFVMNERGIIYKGSGNYITSINWDFGQFEEDMMKICLKMLDVNPKHLANAANDVSARCNPIYVSRVVSAMINSIDDCGVLEGRWSAPFWGGTIPSHWSGSYPILKRWYNIGCHPVKYGQCWVFAGVMCSVMRLLGIPCRVVTNYQSAHDSNKNLIIDVYHADYGNLVSCLCFRNYHVWLECWMRRTDLGKDGKYDGWQVLDPTPQEKSDGAYCCGPASVKAILNGETDLKYDAPFVYAMVNADCIDWLCKADGTMVNIFSDTKRIGQNISTKANFVLYHPDIMKVDLTRDMTLVMICQSEVTTIFTLLNQRTVAEVVFMNPINKMLTDCTLTISGSGLMDGEEKCMYV